VLGDVTLMDLRQGRCAGRFLLNRRVMSLGGPQQYRAGDAASVRDTDDRVLAYMDIAVLAATAI
jgi:hypothetical protein